MSGDGGAVQHTSAPADLARAGREDLRPPESELATALLGDGSLLVPLSAHGEPQQLFWPHPDRDANIAGFALGLVMSGDRDGDGDGDDRPDPVWLRSLPCVQHVEDDADIITTELAEDAAPGEDVTSGGVRLTTVIDPVTGCLAIEVRLAAASQGPRRVVLDLHLALGGAGQADATMVDPSGVLVGYRRDRVLAVAHRCDDGRHSDAADSTVHPPATIVPAGPQGSSGEVRLIAPPASTTTLVLGFAHDVPSAVTAVQAAAGRGFGALVAARRDVDRAAAVGRTPTLVDGRLDVLDRIGLRVLRALQDRDGGVLAAPESDPTMRRSGGYGFVWARDLAFIVTAAAVAGQRDVVDGALDWLVRAQSADGLYEQRHWSDATLAPSWGLQLDETGAVLHAIGEAARVLGPDVVERCWPTVVAGADALTALLDARTGLPPASLDAWEERVGVHTYTVAATIAGLEASARMAEGRDDDAAARWADAARHARTGLDTYLWSDVHGRFLRSRDVAREDGEGAPVPPGHQPAGRPAHPVASVDVEDATVDASLLGLAYPFAVLDPDDERLVATIDVVERELRCGPGLLRYPGDTYLGGNPWLLTRLWLGLARRAPGARTPAEGIADVAGCATSTGLLAEQVDATTGRPVWVVPLAWSHAFYALACRPDHRSGSGA